MKVHPFDYLIKGVLLFIIYFLSARAGLGIDAVSGFATLVWLPTGISIAALYIFGNKFWPFIALGAFFANTYAGAPIPVASGIAIGNMLEATVAAFLIKNFAKLNPAFDRLGEVQRFIIFVLFSTLISPTIGVTSLLLGGIIPFSAYDSTWVAWWIGDAISALVITPFILVWWANKKHRITFKKIAEFGIVALVLVTFTWLIFIFSANETRPITYLVFPPLVWLCLRFTPRTALTSAFILIAFATWMTIRGMGPFVSSSVSQSLLYLQSYTGVMAITVMLLVSAVSDRKRLERKKDEFLSVASHELRTPLTSIKIFADLMQKKFEKKGDKESLLQAERINKQIDRLTRLVSELLDVDKIQEGEVPFHKEKFNLTELIREIAEDIGQTTKRRIVIKKGQDFKIVADRDRIGQVMTNLISNAIKYSPVNKKIVVEIVKNKRYLTTSVRDFGIGIHPEEYENIFDRFYRIKKTDGNGNKSMGLGLFIAKEIVERHKGEIWVESNLVTKGTEKRGSTFYFTLPL